MKFIQIAIPCLFLFACKPSNHLQNAVASDTVISRQELIEIIDTLSNDNFEGRKPGTNGIDRAASYIENYLKANNIGPFFKTYRDSFQVYDIDAYNVIGLIEGNDPVLKKEFIVLSAHYDHIGMRPGNADSVYNGANDNASGVSTVLNVAKILNQTKSNKRSVIVALFSAEEMGLLGAEQFAIKMSDRKSEFYCAVNVDMIGSQFNAPGKVYLSGYQLSNMPEVLNKYIGSEEILQWDKEDFYGLFSLSDNYPIWEYLKIPAHTFCTFDFKNFKHYHKLTDELAVLDADNTVLIANHISNAFRKLAAEKDKTIKLKEN